MSKHLLLILLGFGLIGCASTIVGLNQYALLDVDDIRNSQGNHYVFTVTESDAPSDIGLEVLLCGVAHNGELVAQIAEGRKECLWDYQLDVADRYVTGYLIDPDTLTPTSKWWRDGTLLTLQKVKKGLHPVSQYKKNSFKISISKNELYKEYKELVEPVMLDRRL